MRPVLFVPSEHDARRRSRASSRTHGRHRQRLHQLFWRHLRLVRNGLALAALCTLAVSLTDLLKPWPLKIVIDHALGEKPLPESLVFLERFGPLGTMQLLIGAAATIVLLAALNGLFSYLQVFITSAIGYRAVYSLRRELFTHLQRLSLAFHNRARTGDLLTRLGSDTSTLKDVFTDFVLDLGSHVMMVVGMLAVLVTLNWKVGCVAVATFPFLCFSLFHVYRKTKVSSKEQKRHEGQAAARMNEVLSAIPLVQAFAREKYEEERYDRVTVETMRESIRISRLKAAASRSSEVISAVGTAAALLMGALQVLEGKMLAGDLVVVMSYLSSMYKPMRKLAKLSTEASKAAASAERLTEVLDAEPDVQDRPDAIHATRIKGEIRFKDVAFDYGDGKDVLQHVSFAVAPGQRLALVGASGAGKSTIVSLIMRFHDPQEGAILVDGVDIRRYKRESLRRRIALVPQQSLLFGASIRENIAYGNPEAGDAEIVAAASAANADEFIAELEDGYDTVIGERGATLSGGQQQRIAIARALIRNAPILMLDEPMTGLDVESEAKVREALDRLMAGKTCIIITHDLQSTAGADQVLVLEEGRIIERGSHAELIASSRRYRQLYELDAQRPTAGMRA